MNNFLQISVIVVSRLFIIPLFLHGIWEQIAYEFNLPTFSFGFFVAISALIMTLRICQLMREAFQHS